jgi:hypothetical protein
VAFGADALIDILKPHINLIIKDMATLTLHHHENSPQWVKDLLNPVKPYNSLSEIVDFCTVNKIIDETKVTQHEPDDDYNITISMQEIKAVYDEGECPEDLDFF